MAVTINEVAYATAAAILVLFSAWLLYLSPRQRATRALATLLISVAVLWGSELYTELLPLRGQLALSRVYPLVILSVGLSTIFFLCVYPRPRGWIGRSRWGGWSMIGAGALLWSVFLVQPSLWGTPVVEGGAIVDFRPGPFAFVNNVWTLTSAALLIMLAREHTRAPPGPVRRAMTLVLTAFMVSAVVWQTSLILNDLGRRLTAEAFTTSSERVQYVIEELTLLTILVAPAIVIASARGSTDSARRREAWGIALALGLTLLVAGAAWAFGGPPPPGGWTSHPQQVADALGGVAIAALCGYGLLKHRLFDIDVKLKWTIRRGTVAAIFVAVFFAASQVAQNFLAESYGWMAGGLVAGLLLFAIAPIQRVADRVAAVAMPGVSDGGVTADKRATFYQTAIAMALTDGVITRVEERHLAQLAEQLGLTHTEALRLREEIETATLARSVTA